MRARKPASFWRENMIAVVILPRVLARTETFRFKDEDDYEYEILLKVFFADSQIIDTSESFIVLLFH